MALHFYLSQRSYSLSADKAGKSSLCHIHSDWNCDRALSSPYSDLAGVPLSNYGGVLNFIIAVLSLLLMAKREQVIGSALGFFAILSASASCIMLALSFWILRFFCPLCMVLHILSFLILFCAFFHTPLLSLSWAKSLKKEGASWLLGSSVAFVSLSFLIHLIFIQVYDIKSINKTVQFQVRDWLSAPKKEPVGTALLTSGPSQEKALMTITEFADFLCFHCQSAYYSLKALALPHIRREYFAFPLDQCQGPSLSCRLIRAVYCAKEQNKGWDLHDLIFENQSLFISLRDQADKAFEALKKRMNQTLIDKHRWQECIDSPFAFETQNQQIQASQKRGITSTPSLFVNDKKISHQYLTKTLKAIYHREQKPH